MQFSLARSIVDLEILLHFAVVPLFKELLDSPFYLKVSYLFGISVSIFRGFKLKQRATALLAVHC